MPQQYLTDNQVLDETRVLVRKGKIRWTLHVEERMVERGYARDQITECLLSGYFIERPIDPNRGGELQYQFRIRGNIDGEVLEIVASLIPETRVVVITVIDPKN
jgi:hypothetical protein